MLYSGAFDGPVALGSGRGFTSRSPRCLRIFFMTSWSSMKEMTRIRPWHLGQVRGIHFINLLDKPCPFFEVLFG